MTEDEARGLVAAIDAMSLLPSTDHWVLEGRRCMERYAAEAKPDGSWRVVVLWGSPPHRYGLRIDKVYDIAGYDEATLEEAAVARWGLVEEPHGCAADDRTERERPRPWWWAGPLG